MWVLNETLLEIFFRTSIIYILVLFGIRLTGKREVGQLTPFDLVLLLLIANAVQNAMTGPDTSITGGVIAAGTLLFLNIFINSVVLRSRKLRQWVEGTPTLLVHHGKVISKNLSKEKVTMEELQQALREHGIATIEEVGLAVLEIDGAISMLKKDDMPRRGSKHQKT